MTPDWSAYPEPIPYADLSDPQTLNLYGYVRNNPLNRTDPDGHCEVDGEKHGWLWCAAHSAGFTQTAKEKQAVVEEERTWLIENVANNDSERDVFKQASSKQIGQIYGQWNNAVLSAQSCEVQYQAIEFKRADIVNFTVFRGGPLEATAKDVRMDSRTGLLKNTHGVSLNIDWTKVTRFGDPHQILSLPPGLQIIQRGTKDPGHFEIAPLHPGTMSLEQFNQLLQQVVTKLLTP